MILLRKQFCSWLNSHCFVFFLKTLEFPLRINPSENHLVIAADKISFEVATQSTICLGIKRDARYTNMCQFIVHGILQFIPDFILTIFHLFSLIILVMWNKTNFRLKKKICGNLFSAFWLLCRYRGFLPNATFGSGKNSH